MPGSQPPIFALDIGTRKVTGLVVQIAGKGCRILAAETLEHETRSMIDGQIHDIDAVAEVVGKVKESLEEQLGAKLEKAAVAAAGRSLLAKRVRIVRPVPEDGEIFEEDIRAMELEAVQQAQAQLKGALSPLEGQEKVVQFSSYRSTAGQAAEGKSRGEEAHPLRLAVARAAARVKAAQQETDTFPYHCVGYSVVHYELDGSRIGSLAGHRGKEMAVEVLTTFLPEIVVDSLYTVLRRVGLEIQSMTLEPIAASHVVIPPTLRHLNLALVDIGAGTSDIALTSGGSVVAYAMVPFAGDEVTEKLCERYLVDFNTAEKLKRSVNGSKQVTYQDILGEKHTVSSDAVIGEMALVVETLAEKIAEKIKELNEKTPGAVILVGGGSQTPGLPAKLAEKLNIPADRVVIKTREALAEVSGLPKKITGPGAITPIGIAMTARMHEKLTFRVTDATVNGKAVRLFTLSEPTAADLLLAAGIDAKRLRGRLGLSMTVKVNGALRIVKGTMGKPGKIEINGQPAELGTIVPHKARVTVTMAEDGRDAVARVSDLIPELPARQVFFNGAPFVLRPLLMMNGRVVDFHAPVVDGADIYVMPNGRLIDLLKIAGVDLASLRPVPYIFFINDQKRGVLRQAARVIVDGQPADLEAELQNGQAVELVSTEKEVPRVAEVLTDKDFKTAPDLHITVNKTPVVIRGPVAKITVNGKAATLDDPVPPNGRIKISGVESQSVALSEVFKYVPFDPHEFPDKTLVILMNGKTAGYNTPLVEGAEIQLYWSEEDRGSFKSKVEKLLKA
ncbi:MAG: cell division protein FtsA [Syntrophothermus sp.]